MATLSVMVVWRELYNLLPVTWENEAKKNEQITFQGAGLTRMEAGSIT
jgi:hypothetical protein